MRRAIIATCFSIMLLAVPPVWAKSAVHAELSGGLGIPVGDLSEHTNSGYSFIGGVAYTPSSLSDGEISFVLEGRLSSFESATEHSPDYDFKALGINLRFTPKIISPERYFLQAGVGFANVERSEFGYPVEQASTSGTYPYGSLGFGFEYAKGPVQPFIMARLSGVTGELVGNYIWLELTLGLRI